MNNAKGTDKKYKYIENTKTAERIGELIGDTPSGTVAQALGVSRQTISNFVNGRYKPDGDNLEKLADYFNVSTDYILGRTDVKSSNTTIIDMCKYINLSEESVKYLHSLDVNSSNLLDRIFCQTVSDNPLMEQDYYIFTRLINRALEYILNATETEINKNNRIKASELAKIYGSDVGIYDEEKKLELRLKAKGYGIYITETILEAQLLEIERLLSQILKSIVREFTEEQQRSETNGTNRNEKE